MILHQTDLAVETLRPGDDGYDDAAKIFFATRTWALARTHAA
jgi:hypothetical protein